MEPRFTLIKIERLFLFFLLYISLSFFYPIEGNANRTAEGSLTNIPTKKKPDTKDSVSTGGVSLVELNQAPQFISLPLLSVQDNQEYRYSVQLTDGDTDPIELTGTVMPSWLSLEKNGEFIVSTVAGGGLDFTANGIGTRAHFSRPQDVVQDSKGNIFVTSTAENCVRKITPDGVVSFFAGTKSNKGIADGTGTDATFTRPRSLAIDASDNLYVADIGTFDIDGSRINMSVRKISPEGVVTTVAGGANSTYQDSFGNDVRFLELANLAIDNSGNLLISDSNKILKMTPAGVITVLAGGQYGNQDGSGTDASFSGITDMSADNNGNVYLVSANSIRKVTTDGVVTTLLSSVYGFRDGTGTEALFSGLSAIAIADDGNIYVGDRANRRIRKITPELVVTTFMGNGENEISNGEVEQATVNYPEGIFITRSGSFLLASTGFNRIRKIDPRYVLFGSPSAHVGAHDVTLTATDGNGGTTAQSFTITVSEAPVFTSAAQVSVPENVTGTVYTALASVTDTNTDIEYRLGSSNDESFFTIDTTSGAVSFANTPDFETPLNKDFNNRYILEIIATAGVASTNKIVIIALTNVSDEPPVFESEPVITSLFTNSDFHYDISVFDPSGDDFTIRSEYMPRWLSIEQSPGGRVTSFAGSGRAAHENGKGSQASFYFPGYMAYDKRTGDLYVTDSGNSRVRKIDKSGVVTSFAGSGTEARIDGTGNEASFRSFTAIEVDDKGNVYVASDAHIRKITPEGVVSTFAGNDVQSFADGTGTEARFRNISDLMVDTEGNLFITDLGSSRIRKADQHGVVTTIAGTGTHGNNDGTATEATFAWPVALASDKAGNLFVYDRINENIRKITPDGQVSTVAGGNSGGSVDGTGTSASFTNVSSMIFDKSDTLYINDDGVLRKMSPDGVIRTFTGAFIEGTGPVSKIGSGDLAFDMSGTLFIADRIGHKINQLSAPGAVLVGNTGGYTGLQEVRLVAQDETGLRARQKFYLFVSDDSAPIIVSKSVTNLTEGEAYNYRIETKHAEGKPVTVTGENLPSWLSLSKTEDGLVRSIAGNGYSGSRDGAAMPDGTNLTATYGMISGVEVDSEGNVYTVSEQNNKLRKLSVDGIVTTIAGDVRGSANGTGTEANFSNPKDLAIDSQGNIYIADIINTQIRKVTPAGVVTTFAGSATSGTALGTGTNASFSTIGGIAIDSEDNLFVTELVNYSIRKITPEGVVTNYVGGGWGTADGDLTTARFSRPLGIDTDSADNLYLTDGSKIRKISKEGQVTTLAGSAVSGFKDGSGTAAQFGLIQDLALDSKGNVYVVDADASRIRKVTQDGVVTTVAGSGNSAYADGIGTNASFNQMRSIAIDPSDNVIIGDFSGRIRKLTFSVYTLKGDTNGNAGQHTIKLKAEDEDGDYNTQEFILEVEDVSVPVFTSPTEVTVKENTVGVVYTATATDPSELSYSFVYGKDEHFFDILEGEVTFKQTPDFENPHDPDKDNIFTFEVEVTDGVNRATQVVDITVTDEQEGFPGFLSTPVLEVDEDQLYQYDVNVSQSDQGPFNLDLTEGPSWLSFGKIAEITSIEGEGSVLTKDAAGNFYTVSGNKILKIEPSGNSTVLAGTDDSGYQDGFGAAAKFFLPEDITIGPDGNIYVADSRNHKIRMITPAGQVSTYAGSEFTEWKEDVDGPRLSAQILWPSGLVFDSNGNLFVADSRNQLIRKIDQSGMVSTVAGRIELVYINRGNGPQPADSRGGFADGTGSNARFHWPNKVAIDSENNVYVTDRNNDRIRKVTPGGVVTTLAGGVEGNKDGLGTNAQFNNPQAIAVDSENRIYVASGGYRMILPDGTVTTIAGGARSGVYDGIGDEVQFQTVINFYVDENDDVYFNHASASKIRKISLTEGTLLVGNPDGQVGEYPVKLEASEGSAGVVQEFTVKVLDVTAPVFDAPDSLSVDENSTADVLAIVTTDKSAVTYSLGTTKDEAQFVLANDAIRFTSTPDFEAPQDRDINNTYELDIIATDDAGNSATHSLFVKVNNLNDNAPVFIGTSVSSVNDNETFEYRPVAIDPDFGKPTISVDNLPAWLSLSFEEYSVSTLAGSGTSARNNGVGTEAGFSRPTSVVMDSKGNLFVADEGMVRIRKIDPNGVVSHFSGSGAYDDEDGNPDEANFRSMIGLAIDENDFLYVSDYRNYSIRRIDPLGKVTTYSKGGGYSDNSLGRPGGIAIDNKGNLWVADRSNFDIKKVAPDGQVSSLAGTSTNGFSDGNGTDARFISPVDVALDNSGNLYVIDGNTLRKVTPQGDVTTIAGALESGFVDGPASSARFNNPSSVLVAPDGNVYIMDAGNYRLRKLDTSGNVSTVVGQGDGIFKDGVGTDAGLTYPTEMSFDKAGDIIFTERDSYTVRKIDLNQALISGNAQVKSGPYSFRVSAVSGSQSTEQQVDFNVLDVTAPIITSSESASVKEGVTEEVYTVTATDFNTLVFSLGTDNDESLFEVVNNVISFKSETDYESPSDDNFDNRYLLEVIASDEAANQASQLITIEVTDANDNAPVITSNGGGPTANINVAENTTVITTVTATDADALTPYFNFVAPSGVDQALFDIDLTTGVLTWRNGAPDFENPLDSNGDNVYEVTVLAIDGPQATEGTLSTAQDLSIMVTKVGEGPEFTSPTAVNFSENSTDVVYVPTVENPQGVIFSFGSSNDEHLFKLENGLVKFLQSPDFENPEDADQNNTYVIEIIATQGGNSAGHEVTITVLNRSESIAVITSNGGGETANISVPENQTAVTMISAMVEDNEYESIDIYFDNQGDEALFDFDYASGALTFKTLPDFENPIDKNGDNIYEVSFSARPGACPDCLPFRVDRQSLFIQVTDEDENTIRITSNGGGESAEVVVEERSLLVTTVTVVGASPAAMLSYSKSGPDSDKFELTDSGELSFIIAPDYESPADVDLDNTYQITATVTDGITSDAQDISVSVRDINESIAVITSNGGGETANISVPENQAAVTMISAMVEDNEYESIDIYFDNQGDEALFDFDYASGALTFKTLPDFENPIDKNGDNIYEVSFSARPGACPDCLPFRVDRQSLFIQVTDEDENTIRITSNGGGESAEVVVEERSLLVATVTVAGASPAAMLSFSKSGPDSDKFELTDSGELSFIIAPDYESPADVDLDNTYQITATVTDGITSDAQNISVRVRDINESIAVITSNGGGETANIIVSEGQVAVTTINAMIIDSEYESIDIYFDNQGDEALFDFDYAAGALTFKTLPDFENPIDKNGDNIYEVSFSARPGACPDCLPFRIDRQSLFIRIVAKTEVAPIITSPQSVSFTENGTGVAYTTQATDTDVITYSLGSQNDESLFNIDSNTGAVTFTASPDFEAPIDADGQNNYSIEVKANDGIFEVSLDVTITVTDVNDNAPVITSNGGAATANIQVAENSTEITTVTATDADALTPYFNFVAPSGADEALFDIDLTSGVLTWKNGAPDFENPLDQNGDNVYEVTVLAIDGPQATAGTNATSQELLITVTDIVEDVTGPIVSISSVSGKTSGAFTATIVFNEEAVGFTLDDIVVANGVASDLIGAGLEYSATITPSAEGVVTVDVAENALTDAVGNGNSAAVQLSIENDETKPTVVLSTEAASPEFSATTSVAINFSENVTGFTVDDITVVNGIMSNLTGAEGSYSADVAPITDGEVTINIGAGVVQDEATNTNETSNSLPITFEATNEAPTAIDLSSATVTENTDSGFEVGTLSATDVDLNDAHNFTLVTGTGSDDNALFKVIGNSLFTNTVPDFEIQSSYSVRLRATDLRGLTFDAVKTITVVNVDEPVLTTVITDPADSGTALSSLSFDNTRVGQTDALILEVKNSGTDGDLVVSGITLPDGFSVSESAFTLSANATKSLTVSFAPTAGRIYQGNLVISANTGSKNISVTGLGLANNPPVAVAPSSTVFYTVGQTIELLGYDPDGDAIEYEIVSAPTQGTLTETATAGLYTYTPSVTTPEVLHEDSFRFRVKEVGGGLSSEEAEYRFNYQIADVKHDITTMSVLASSDTEIEFSLSFTDEVINDNYSYELSYFDQAQNTFVSLRNTGLAKEDLTIVGNNLSFNITETAQANAYLFDNATVVLLFKLSTANGFSDSEAFLLENTVDGAGISSTISTTSEDGKFVVFAAESDVPEGGQVEVNLFAVEFEDFSLENATVTILKDALKGSTGSITTVKRSAKLAQWSVTYDSETEVGLLDSLQFSVFSPTRDANGSAYARINVVEVADAPVIEATADLQINEEETRTIDLSITDPDSEIEVTAISSDGTNVPVTISGNQLELRPVENYSGTVSITVIVKESNSTVPLTAFDQFQVTVVPVNDKPVVSPLADVTIEEDNTVTVTLSATDVDATDNAFTYSVTTADNENVSFEVEGDVLTIAPEANFNGVLSFEVTANDGSGTANAVSEAETFAINVNAVNDAPVVSATLNTQSLIAGFPAYTLDLSQFFADEETASDQLTYTVSTASSVDLSINAAVMTVTAKAGASGTETVTVTASDGDLSVQQTVNFVTTAASTTVTVANPVADVILNEDFGTKTIDLSSVFSYSADANAVFTYSLSGNSSLGATINGQTLELSADADFNGADALIIVGTTDGKSTFTSFDITVTPVNDAPVLFKAVPDNGIAQDQAFTKVIGLTTFSDVDGDALSYKATYTADWLSWNSATRTFTGTPANADVGTVTVTVTATDTQGEEASDSFDIVVSNVNDNPTDISLSASGFDENLASGTTIGTLASTDIDVGDDSFSYQLVSGTGDDDNSKFSIVGNELILIAGADFETVNSYSVRIRTTDGFEGTYTEAFTLSINDVNEAATDMSLSAETLAEGLVTGTAVASLSTIDPDAGDSHTYALVAGEGDTDNASFTIGGDQLLSAGNFDFETKTSYSVRLKSTDANGISYEESFTIAVTNVNEAATDIALSVSSIDENSASGATIATLSSVDEDAGDSHSYTLVAGDGDADNASFAVADGELKAASTFDFETKSTLNIRLKTSDADGLSYEEQFTITVNDVNEAPTSVSLENSNIDENSPVGTAVGSLSTADQDNGDVHTYELVAGTGDTDNTAFSIVAGQLVTATEVDFEIKERYSVRLKTTDAAGLSFEQSVEVNVNNVAEAILRVGDGPTVPVTGRGMTSEFDITIFNDGDATLEVLGIAYPEAYSGATDGISIAPGTSERVSVTFSPTELRVYAGLIEITTNVGNESVSVSGEGTTVTSIDNGVIPAGAISLYPNPANEILTIDLSELAQATALDIEIVSTAGTRMFKVESYRDLLLKLDVSDYRSGIYLIHFTNGESAITKKVIINH